MSVSVCEIFPSKNSTVLCAYSISNPKLILLSFSKISPASIGHSTVKCILHLSPAAILGWSVLMTSSPVTFILLLPVILVGVTACTYDGIVPTLTISTANSTPEPG